MTPFLIGSLLLALIILGGHLMRRGHINTSGLTQFVRLFLGFVVLAAGAAFAMRAQLALAIPLGLVGYVLVFGWPFSSSAPQPMGGQGPMDEGQTSRIATDFLEMELNHDSGRIRGRVLKGIFAGRSIDTLKPEELALLWQDLRADDPQSAQLIEAYLDGMYPSWREDVQRGEQKMRGPDGRMSREEALEILGLSDGASDDDVRKAHRELMMRFHPDRGGSTYLASKINEAKDVLLG